MNHWLVPHLWNDCYLSIMGIFIGIFCSQSSEVAFNEAHSSLVKVFGNWFKEQMAFYLDTTCRCSLEKHLERFPLFLIFFFKPGSDASENAINNLASVIHSFHLCHSKLFVNLLCHVLYSLNKCVTELKELVEKNVKANGWNAGSKMCHFISSNSRYSDMIFIYFKTLFWKLIFWTLVKLFVNILVNHNVHFI